MKLNISKPLQTTNTKILNQIIKIVHEDDEKMDVMKRVGNTI